MNALIVLMVIVTCFVSHRLCKTIFSPACLGTLFFSFLMIGSVLLYANSPDFQLFFGGYFFICLSCIFLSIGEYYGKRIKIKSGVSSNKRVVVVGQPVFKYVYIALVLVSFLDLFVIVTSRGFSIADFLDIRKFLSMTNSFGSSKNETESGVFVQLLNCIAYITPFFGGYLFFSSKRKRYKILGLIGILPILLISLITTGKIGIIIGVILFVVGYIVAFYQKRKCFRRLRIQEFIFLGIIALFLYVVFISAMCVRIGAFDSETINLVHGKFRLYAFSEIQAFSVFLENRQYDLTSLGFGKNTFMSIYNLFSGESKVAGVYTIMEGTETNVFTAYRGLIEDYSFVGTLVFEFIVGFISGVSLKAIKRNRPSTIALVALAISYYFILYSFIISPWIYTIEILMFVIMFIVFLLFFRRKVIKNKKSIMKSRVTRYV